MKRTLVYIAISLTAMNAIPENSTANILSECLVEPNHTICQTEALQIYVGPQSVEPGMPLYIAVESANAMGGSGNATDVIIINSLSGETYAAAFENGLAQIEIEAPTQAGRLTFTAKVNNISSQPAEVLVTAAAPSPYELFLEKDRNTVFASSSLLADRYGNLIEDGQAANIRVISKGTVIASEAVTTLNGRVATYLNCDDLNRDDTSLEVEIRGTKSGIKIPAFMCRGSI